MRALWMLASLAGLAACRPDIGYNTYSCGANASCPDDQACDETMDVCLSPVIATPFTCTVTDREPDNTIATATPITGLTCAASPQNFLSCLEDGDTLDMFTFTSPASCTELELQVVLSYPVSYEALQVTLTGSDGTSVVANDMACDESAVDSLVTRCLTAPLGSDMVYALRVEPLANDTDSDCAGSCAYNRYTLTVQTTTP